MVNLNSFKKIQKDCKSYKAKLVVVSKYQSIEDINRIDKLGVHDFGENKVQDLEKKIGVLSENIQWHFIGHLQRNKVKKIVPLVALIHSIDSLKLLEEVNKRAIVENLTLPVLLQVHIAKESSKYGIQIKDLEDFINKVGSKTLNNVQISGLMGMASNTLNTKLIKSEFSLLRKLYEDLRGNTFPKDRFNMLSMGMSSDYKIALDEGSTLVRIGSAIFS